MIKKILKFVILFLLILLQTSNFAENTLKRFDVKPDFVLIFIAYISLTSSFIASESMGFFAGILLDILSYVIIGINAFTLTIVASLLNLFKAKLFIEKSFSIFIIIFVTSIIYRIIYSLLTIIFIHKINFFKTIIKLTLPEALYTAIFGIILFPIYNYIFSNR